MGDTRMDGEVEEFESRHQEPPINEKVSPLSYENEIPEGNGLLMAEIVAQKGPYYNYYTSSSFSVITSVFHASKRFAMPILGVA